LATEPEPLNKEGYTFNGWNFDFSTPITQDTIINAMWTQDETPPIDPPVDPEPTIYTVTFKDGDQVVSTQSIEDGKLATEPAPLSKEGYTFNGWNFDFSTPITADISINATWTLNTYTVKFSLNGGIGDLPPEQSVRYGEYATKPTTEDPTRYEYDFRGWTLNSVGFTEFDFGNTPITDNITINAGWAVKTLNVYFDMQGGTPQIPPKTGGSAGSVFSLPRGDDLTRADHVFNGWDRRADNKTALYHGNDNASLYGETDITFYAIWHPLVTIDGVELEILPNTTIHTQLMMDKPFPTEEGKIFMGWVEVNTPNTILDPDTTVLTGGMSIKKLWGDDIKSMWTKRVVSSIAIADLDKKEIIELDIPNPNGYTLVYDSRVGRNKDHGRASIPLVHDNGSEYSTVFAMYAELTDNKIRFYAKDNITVEDFINYESGEEEVVFTIRQISPATDRYAIDSYVDLVLSVDIQNGSAEKPWAIPDQATLELLKYLHNRNSDEHSKLTDNITLTFEEGERWTGIPNIQGGLDGDNYTIKGLQLDSKTGLFNTITGATIKNLNIEAIAPADPFTAGALSSGIHKYGALAGSATDSTISNVSIKVDGTITANTYTSTIHGDDIGGLVGFTDNTTFTGVFADVDIDVTRMSGKEGFGGLVGRLSSSTIDNSYTVGDISTAGDTDIADVFAPINVAHVGGLVGRMEDNSSVTNSYATGKVIGEHVGGLIGYLDNTTHTVTGNLALNSSVANITTKLTLTNTYPNSVRGMGRVFGSEFDPTSTINSNKAFNDMILELIVEPDSSHYVIADNATGGHGKHVALATKDGENLASSAFAHFDTDIWVLEGNEFYGLPILKGNRLNSETTPVHLLADVDGSSTNPYLIETVEDLALIDEYPNRHFKLTDNLTWSTSVATFAGGFDGDNHTITTGVPLFSTIDGSVSDNISKLSTMQAVLKSFKVGGMISSTENNLGFVAREASSALLDNISTVAGSSISGGDNVGGIIGVSHGDLSVTNVTNNADVNGTGNFGEIIGNEIEPAQRIY
ncbi:MAG: InlB B-repeat-containing protein, partial [Deferribacteraceae bacterium]|nr:InlB B-repeat-containing protein [Deferribacteraceae bacterium]